MGKRRSPFAPVKPTADAMSEHHPDIIIQRQSSLSVPKRHIASRLTVHGMLRITWDLPCGGLSPCAASSRALFLVLSKKPAYNLIWDEQSHDMRKERRAKAALLVWRWQLNCLNAFNTIHILCSRALFQRLAVVVGVEPDPQSLPHCFMVACWKSRSRGGLRPHQALCFIE